jgi:hypothetical protein
MESKNAIPIKNNTTPYFRTSIILVIAITLIGFAIEKLNGLNSTTLPIAIGGILAIVFFLRSTIIKILISPHFAVVLLIFIAFWTILGTLIIQNYSYAEYIRVYGNTITSIIYHLKLSDIFHSFYFRSLLFTLAISLAITIIHRKPFHPQEIGLAFAHFGTIIILIGGLIGILWGEQGYLHLTKGKSADSMIIMKKGKETNQTKPLGFLVTLEDFKVEYYDEDRIAVYEKKKDDYAYLFYINPQKTKEFKLPGGIRTISIIEKGICEIDEHHTKIPCYQIKVTKPSNIKTNSKTANLPKDSFHWGMLTNSSSFTTQLFLPLGMPMPFANDQFIVVYDYQKEPKLFQSILSISENGERKAVATIKVNSPLTYKGYKFYQSNYNPDNLEYSGILVVKDPGLPIVYFGFLIICLGIIYLNYIKPKIIKLQKKKSQILEKEISNIPTTV